MIAGGLTGAGELGRRLIVALVLAPLALAAAWAGGHPFVLLIGIAVLLMWKEWLLLSKSLGALAGALVGLGLFFACALAAFGYLRDGFVTLAVMAAAALLGGSRDKALWAAGGVFYIGLPALSAIWLRMQPDGLGLVLWLFAAIWASDTLAYVAGRLLGGPRLLRAVSPGKTWAGLGGALLGAMTTGWAVAFSLGWPNLLLPALGGLALGLAGQGGDLLESAVKRRFGAKDSGRLLPGHGGALDRLDSMLTAAPAMALAVWLRESVL
jgi:phosphatidate cytidylyltransferase